MRAIHEVSGIYCVAGFFWFWVFGVGKLGRLSRRKRSWLGCFGGSESLWTVYDVFMSHNSTNKKWILSECVYASDGENDWVNAVTLGMLVSVDTHHSFVFYHGLSLRIQVRFEFEF